jgi:ABC-type antimicrobial peptide transport system permease subunit
MNLLVRTDVPPQSAISIVRAQVSELDADQPISDIQTAEDLINRSQTQPRFTTLLIGGFSAAALVLATVGIYGVLSYSVAERRQEFGIRLALGAHQADIMRMIMRQGLFLAGIGIAVGLGAALMLTRVLESVLYRTGSRDVATFILAPLLFLGVAALASYLPARRATRVDPVEALR